MKWYWKIAIGFVSLIVLVLLLNISLNLWIKYQLPKIINEQNDSAYAITYKKLKVSLLDSNISADDIVIVPKAALKDNHSKAGIYAKVRSVEINHFKLWALIFDNKIKAQSVSVNRPEFILYKKNDKAINNSKSIRSSVVAPFEKIISVPDIFLHHGTLKIVYVKNNRVILDVKDIELTLNGIIITEDILKEKIPFYFKDYSLSCNDIYYHPNQFYNIRSQ